MKVEDLLVLCCLLEEQSRFLRAKWVDFRSARVDGAVDSLLLMGGS